MPAVSPIELGRELMTTLREVNVQIEEVKDRANSEGIIPYKMRDAAGNFVLAPLLVSKSQLLHSLALLNQKGK